jgi:Na+-driven multidrug efflux pump
MSTIAAIVNLIANYVLISKFGAVGAAQATLLSFVVQYVGVWWYANQIFPMPWKSPAFKQALQERRKP